MTDNSQTPDNRLRLPRLVEYRRTTTKRYAAAFCDVPEYVLGCQVLPVTPRTFSMLLASGNRFIIGGQATEDDVINFIWFHSPEYVHDRHPEWSARKRNALRLFTRQMHKPWIRFFDRARERAQQEAALPLAIAAIREILEDAFACASRGKGNGRVLASLEAQLVDAFADAYGWQPERTRNAPLRQLFQLIRCVALRRGNDVTDDGEDAILAAHLLERNMAALADRAKKAGNHG